MALKPHLIGGAWVEGSDGQDNVNPSDLSDVVGTYGRADRALAEQAIAAAKAAFPAWSRSTPQQRFDILDAAGSEILARKAEIGELLAREEGKIRAEGVMEAARAGQIFKFFAGETLRIAGEHVASVRPGHGVLDDDPDRWCEAGELAEQLGVELLEWFVIDDATGAPAAWCPRDLLAEPPRWV